MYPKSAEFIQGLHRAAIDNITPESAIDLGRLDALEWVLMAIGNSRDPAMEDLRETVKVAISEVKADIAARQAIDNPDDVFAKFLKEDAIKPMIEDDEACPWCGTQPKEYTCDTCGISAMLTDCGHMAQPRPIAADDRGNAICDACVSDLAGKKETP